MSDDPTRPTLTRIDDRPLSDAILTVITEQTGMELLAEHLLFENFDPNALDELIRPTADEQRVLLTTRELSITVIGNRWICLQVAGSEVPPDRFEHQY